VQSLDAADELNVGIEEPFERIDKRTRGVRHRIRPNGFGLVRNAGRAGISCERLLERAKRFARLHSRVLKRGSCRSSGLGSESDFDRVV
jgi:hypothetical protein